MLKKKWFSNTVVSSDGYSVSILNRALALYEEKNKRVYVSVEMLAPKQDWALFPNDMWVGSKRGKKLQDEELRSLIIARMREVFAFLGLSLLVN